VDFSTGHAHQNAERLNDFFKTLMGFYFNSQQQQQQQNQQQNTLQIPNKNEFVAYYILIQLGNRGEVTKFLQRLPSSVINSPEICFVLKIWGALKTENYAKFFRFFKKATLLQACLLFRYVGEVRLVGLKKFLKTHHQKGFILLFFCLFIYL
jgi:hypothetical protein